MGRRYYGDIEGKFMFGSQSSNDGEFFGAYENTSRVMYYADDLQFAEDQMLTCLEKIGDDLQRIEDYFEKNDTYNDEMLIEAGIKDPKYALEWYGRIKLGRQIIECLKEQDTCEYEAEL